MGHEIKNDAKNTIFDYHFMPKKKLLESMKTRSANVEPNYSFFVAEWNRRQQRRFTFWLIASAVVSALSAVGSVVAAFIALSSARSCQ